MAKQPVDPLRLTCDANTIDSLDDKSEISNRLKFYDSSVHHQESGDRLVSVIVDTGNGMRLTYPQAQELRDWLNTWLAKGPLGG